MGMSFPWIVIHALPAEERKSNKWGITPAWVDKLDVHFWQIPTACRQADTWVNVANLRVILSQERAVFNAVSRMKGELKKECFL
ncbi:MAG: hypothetical protein ACLSF6_05935 [Evtepia gabavorous]